MSSFSTKKKNHMSFFFFFLQYLSCSHIIYNVILHQDFEDKVSSNSTYNFLLNVNFENLIVRLHIFYVLNMHVECSNRILFIIWSKNLFFMQVYYHKNLKFKHVIDNIVINLWSSWNFARTKNIIRICNPKS